MPYESTIRRVRLALRDVFDAMDLWFDKPQPLRAYRPGDGGWSIDEMLEHVTLVNHFLMLVIRARSEKAIKRAETQPVEGKESDLDGEAFRRVADPGAFFWQRPEHMEPTGVKPSEEVRVLMRTQQRECLDILARMGRGEGSLVRVRMSVQDLGKIDMYQWLYFLAMHAERHLRQMEGIEAEWRAGASPLARKE